MPVNPHGGLVQRIQHAQTTFGNVFNKIASTWEGSPINAQRIKDLRASKHRFEVSQRPYARIVLLYEPLLDTARTIARGRHGLQCAKDAIRFLREETTEVALQRALMADAGDECLRRTRFFDQENFDVSKTANVISDHLATINALFCQRLALKTGFTKHMLETLSKPLLVPMMTDG